MKIRFDFVSNSSSSSFMMIGKWDEDSELAKFVKDNYRDWIEKSEYKDELDDDIRGYIICDIINDNAIGFKAKHEIGDNSENTCLGLEYEDMKNNETKKQFEDRIKKSLSDFYKTPINKIEICKCSGYC